MDMRTNEQVEFLQAETKMMTMKASREVAVATFFASLSQLVLAITPGIVKAIRNG